MTSDDDLMIRYFHTGLEHDLPDHLRREEARLEELLGTIRGVSRRLPGSLHPAVYSNNPGFTNWASREGLPFKAYDDFTAATIEERQDLYWRLSQLVWSPERIRSRLGAAAAR